MKVIGLERGPRLKTADFSRTMNCATSNGKNWPEPEAHACHVAAEHQCACEPLPILNYGNQAAAAPFTTARSRGAFMRTISARGRIRLSGTERHRSGRFVAADWPMTYADLEPFYDRPNTSSACRASGQFAGRKIDGGNVFEAPRSREYRCGLARGSSRVCFSKPGRASWVTTRSPPRARFFRSLTRTGRVVLTAFLPVVRLPRRREVEHPGHETAGSRRNRQLQIGHRDDVLSREHGQ